MINRHLISRDVNGEFNSALSKFEKFNQKIKLSLENNKVINLWAFKDLGLRLSSYSLITKNYIIVLKGLISYLNSGVAHLQKEFCAKPSLKVDFDNESFTIESTKTKSGTELFDWWKLFNIALILRDNQHKNELFNLLSNSVKETKDPFWRKSIKLISMCNDKIEFETSILSDIKSIVSSSVVAFHNIEGSKLIKSKEGNDIREKIWLPIMEMYYLAYQKDANTFNILLEQYLISKKNWIIEKKEEDNSSYWIDFPLLACCSYAYDNGIVINVESDYIPDIVYKGGL